MAFYDSLTDGEAYPRPLIFAFGMEPLENLEDTIIVLGVDPDAIVGYGKNPEFSVGGGGYPNFGGPARFLEF